MNDNSTIEVPSDRRRFVRKLVGLGAAAGIGGLLLAREKTGLLPLAQAASGDSLLINENNSGDTGDIGGTTGLTATTAGEPTFRVENLSDQTNSSAVAGVASNTSGITNGVYGESDSVDGRGVYGYASNASGFTYGVRGESDSIAGYGVFGVVGNPGGSTYGVYGQSSSVQGHGVYGVAVNASGSTYGVYGSASSVQGCGVEGYASNASGGTIGVYGRSSSVQGIGVLGSAGKFGTKPMVAQGASGQTASLQEWQNYQRSVLAVVDANGQLGVGTGTPQFKINVLGVVDPTALSFDSYGTVASNIIGRRAEGTVGSPSACLTDDALLVLNGRGYGATGFSNASRAAIRLLAAENWTDTAQGAYIRFETTQAGGTNRTERMRITDTGDILPPSDNVGNIGIAGQSWASIKGHIMNAGDLVFENGYRFTEDTGSGMRLMNENGTTIAKFDHEGNLHIKGKVLEDL